MARQSKTNSIDKIAGSLKPWRGAYTAEEVRGGAANAIELLRSVSGDFFDRKAIQNTRAGARLIEADLARLERRITQVSKQSPEMRLRLRERPLGLEWLREECKAAIAAASGKSECKKQCAVSALRLVLTYSEAKPSSGSRTSKFRQIAATLFEAVGGNPDSDIERACEEALRRARPLIGTKRNPRNS